MAKILNVGQDFLIGHSIETLHLFDDKLGGLEDSIGSTLILAQNANTQATNALATVNAAQSAADMANARLAGDTNFFDGMVTFTTAVDTPVTAFNTSSSQGMSYGGGYFNFSYLGYYLVSFGLSGICTSNAGGEVFTYFRESTTPKSQGMTFATHTAGTRNMMANTSMLVKISQGERWTPYLNLNNVTIVGTASLRVQIKKVV